MKGERGIEASCPVCGATINPRNPVSLAHQNQSARTITRKAVREHLVAHHPTLERREISLLLDGVCDRQFGVAQ